MHCEDNSTSVGSLKSEFGVAETSPLSARPSLIAKGSPDQQPTDFDAYAAGLREWGTAVHAAPDGSYHVTEGEFLPAELSATDLHKSSGPI